MLIFLKQDFSCLFLKNKTLYVLDLITRLKYLSSRDKDFFFSYLSIVELDYLSYIEL